MAAAAATIKCSESSEAVSLSSEQLSQSSESSRFYDEVTSNEASSCSADAFNASSDTMDCTSEDNLWLMGRALCLMLTIQNQRHVQQKQ
jgi:hypothetical protein